MVNIASKQVLAVWTGKQGVTGSPWGFHSTVHASDLGSVGQFIGALVAACTFLWGVIKRHDIHSWFADRSVLRDRLALSELKAANQEQRAIAAEQRALNWEKGASGAQFDVKLMEERLEKVEAIVPRFNALMDFTKKLIRYTVYLEQEAVNAGVKLEQNMPDIPVELAELKQD